MIALAGVLLCGTVCYRAAAQSDAESPIIPGVPLSTLTATPSSASFGSVPIGTKNSQTIQLKNTGTASVTILSTSVSVRAFALSGITTPLILAAGKIVNITLSYAPTGAGYVAGSISIVNNAENKTLTITVSGTGVAQTRTLTATPTTLSFGNENVGSSNTLPVTLKNTGNSSVTLSGITITGAGFSETGGTSGSTIAPGQSATVNVTFAPKTSGSISGSMKVTSNATDSPEAIGVSGDGVASTKHSVALSWDASKSEGIVGYNVYRATASVGYTKLTTSLVSGLKYTDTAVVNGMAYEYAVTAVNSGGHESHYSAPIQVTVP